MVGGTPAQPQIDTSAAFGLRCAWAQVGCGHLHPSAATTGTCICNGAGYGGSSGGFPTTLQCCIPELSVGLPLQVHLCGSFTRWVETMPMAPVEASTDTFAVVVHLPPGCVCAGDRRGTVGAIVLSWGSWHCHGGLSVPLAFGNAAILVSDCAAVCGSIVQGRSGLHPSVIWAILGYCLNCMHLCHRQVPPVQIHCGRGLAARRKPAVHAGPPGQRQ